MENLLAGNVLGGQGPEFHERSDLWANGKHRQPPPLDMRSGKFCR
jgi:hypothetical protein